MSEPSATGYHALIRPLVSPKHAETLLKRTQKIEALWNAQPRGAFLIEIEVEIALHHRQGSTDPGYGAYAGQC